MKIRWTDTGIRFRITPSELDALQEGKIVEESLRLTEAVVWNAQILPVPTETGLHHEGATVQIRLSPEDRAQLAQSDREGVYFETEDTPAFRYYIEKDFPCVHPRLAEAAEPKTETFIPPPDFSERKTM
jgi:hypothetical protein